MALPRPLAGRYAFGRRIRGTQRTIIWVARDQETRSNVVASVLTPSRAAGLEHAIGLVHPHAAAVLHVVDHFEKDEVPDEDPVAPDSRIVVAEHLEGRSLQQRLDAGPLSVENAVEWSTAIADALAALHGRRAVHGAVSPRAVLVIRPEPAVVPALTHLLVPPSGAYCSPERVTGAGPSEADDTWALVATLYTALARRPPFQGGSRTELARAIVAAAPRPLDDVDGDLWTIVARGLAHDPRERFESAAAFRDALREWTEMTGRHSIGDFAPVAAMVGVTEEPPNVGDLSLVAALAMPESPEAMAPLDVARLPERPSLDPDAHSDPRELLPRAVPGPPVLPRNDAPTRSASPVVASREGEKPRRSGALVASVVGVAAVAAAAAFVLVSKREHAEGEHAHPAKTAKVASENTAPASGAAAEPSGSEASSAGALADAPLPSAATAAPADVAAEASAAAVAPLDANACVASALPEKTLGDAFDVRYLCNGSELWGLTRKVDQQVLRHGQGAGLSLWVHLGRFDLAAVALLRERCCPGAAPLTAATPKGVCETLTDSTRALASDPTGANAERYAADVECYVSHGVRYPAEWWDRLTAKEARGYFDELVSELRGKPR